MTGPGKLTRRRMALLTFIAPLAVYLLCAPVYGMDDKTPILAVTNVDWRIEGDQVVITYDLTADPEKDCNIGLVLLDEKNPDFKFIPAYVSGEIGKGKFVSGAKEVRWDFKKEFPEGLHGEGFYFEVTTEYVGGFPWLTAGIGAAAVGGGLFAILGSKKNSGNSTATTLPVPPGRP